MQISAATVKELRQKTGVGMMECKGALVEAKGDLAEAEKILRKKGLSAAARKAGRATGEGAISARVAADGSTGVLVEVNCETDFAARNADFRALVDSVTDVVLEKGAPSEGAGVDAAAVEALLEGAGVRARLGEAVAKIGENIQFRRFVKFVRASERSILASYVHTGSKIGVLVEAEAESDPGAAAALLRDLAMHVAAAAPKVVSRDDLSADLLDDEREIARAQAVKSGKPPQVVEKIVTGRMEKLYGEICLLEQAFVKDPDRTVRQVLGAGIVVRRFARFVLGDEA